MGDMLTTKEAAELWKISDSMVKRYCRDGRIPGAIKGTKSWQIPKDAEKPEDQRRTNPTDSESKLPLPIGVTDFRIACNDYYYIDKTLLIRDFIDERPIVSLFTRPRRFGKTLMMDMLRTFFEKTDEDTSIYFQNKKIWACGDKYRKHQGKYPIISLTFKDIKCMAWEETYDLITQLIRQECELPLS